MIAVLFARRDSVYKTLLGCDVYDIDRDALTWPGGYPVVAHPPCRAWGQLSHLANPRAGERELAIWAVAQVRQWGGVLEHPAGSHLWRECRLPEPKGGFDEFGGWTLAAPQFWWGHNANKATRFYISGCTPKNIPEVPFLLGEAPCLLTHNARIAKLKKRGVYVRPECKRDEREKTPYKLAIWLVELAQRCQPARQPNFP